MDTPEHRWLTYREMAAALRLPSPKAALNRSRREGWARRINNTGEAAVAVPLPAIEAARTPSPGVTGPPPDPQGKGGRTPSRAADGEDVALVLAELRVSHAAHVAELRQQLDRAERLAAEERTRADAEREARQVAERRAEAAQARAEGIREELAAWRAGGPLARGWRGFWRR